MNRTWLKCGLRVAVLCVACCSASTVEAQWGYGYPAYSYSPVVVAPVVVAPQPYVVYSAAYGYPGFGGYVAPVSYVAPVGYVGYSNYGEAPLGYAGYGYGGYGYGPAPVVVRSSYNYGLFGHLNHHYHANGRGYGHYHGHHRW